MKIWLTILTFLFLLHVGLTAQSQGTILRDYHQFFYKYEVVLDIEEEIRNYMRTHVHGEDGKNYWLWEIKKKKKCESFNGTWEDERCK